MQISSTMPTTRLLCYVLTLSVYLFGMHVSALHRRQLFGTFMHHPAVASLFESPNRNGNICHDTKKGQFLCNSIRFRNSTLPDVFILENVNIPFLMGTNQLPCCVCECVCQRMSMLFIHICVEMLVTMCTIPNALPQDETYVYFFDVSSTNENPNIFVWPEREI